MPHSPSCRFHCALTFCFFPAKSTTETEGGITSREELAALPMITPRVHTASAAELAGSGDAMDVDEKADTGPALYHQVTAPVGAKHGEWERFGNYDEDDLWGERLFVLCLDGTPACKCTCEDAPHQISGTTAGSIKLRHAFAHNTMHASHTTAGLTASILTERLCDRGLGGRGPRAARVSIIGRWDGGEDWRGRGCGLYVLAGVEGEVCGYCFLATDGGRGVGGVSPHAICRCL